MQRGVGSEGRPVYRCGCVVDQLGRNRCVNDALSVPVAISRLSGFVVRPAFLEDLGDSGVESLNPVKGLARSLICRVQSLKSTHRPVKLVWLDDLESRALTWRLLPPEIACS